MGNIRLGVPVRVIRKNPDESVYKAVYTYDGLYDVVGRYNGLLRGKRCNQNTHDAGLLVLRVREDGILCCTCYCSNTLDLNGSHWPPTHIFILLVHLDHDTAACARPWDTEFLQVLSEAIPSHLGASKMVQVCDKIANHVGELPARDGPEQVHSV